jgi:hypothetical protein
VDGLHDVFGYRAVPHQCLGDSCDMFHDMFVYQSGLGRLMFHDTFVYQSGLGRLMFHDMFVYQSGLTVDAVVAMLLLITVVYIVFVVVVFDFTYFLPFF